MLQKITEDKRSLSIGSGYTATQKIFARVLYSRCECLLFLLLVFVLSESCSLSHILLMFAPAVLNEPDSLPGLTSRLMNRWSCSTILLRYLTLRNSVALVRGSSARRASIAGGNHRIFIRLYNSRRLASHSNDRHANNSKHR